MMLATMILMTLATVAWLTWPLWRDSVSSGQRRRAANVVAYEQRLGEISADESARLLDRQTAQEMRTELDARLLRDAGDEVPSQGAAGRSHIAALLISALVVIGAVLGYAAQGSWQQQQQLANAAPSAAHPPGTVDEMVGRLEQRLENAPDDAQGWAMLGRSYFVLARYADSARAYGEANRLTEQQMPDLLVSEGEALGLARDRDLLGRPHALFDAALKIAPDHAKALWYGGLAAEQAGDAQGALARFQRLKTHELPDSLTPVLNERLAALGAPADAAVPASATRPSASTGALQIRLAVRVDDALKGRFDPQSPLFVFAKAVSGPPMPLAVYRGTAGELPAEIALDDSMSMMPALKLSQFDQWQVTARISDSGQAEASSGDIQGSLTVARDDLGGAALGLTLNQRLP
ncbi:MAG: c-type cytochrome biogenesis protein CcmI [Panacagrimonas sp.]